MSEKSVLSLINLVLLIVPLVSIIFSTIYVYNSSEFIELLVAQPVKRKSIWLSIYFGLAVSLSLAFFVGVGIPIMLYNPGLKWNGSHSVGHGLIGDFCFNCHVGLGFNPGKAKGIGASILLWFFFTLIYDGIVLFILFQFGDYPMEKPMIALTSLNPVDLARVMMLLKLDISALMGYTGALFNEVFGGNMGMIYAVVILMLWAALPLWVSLRKFSAKDL